MTCKSPKIVVLKNSLPNLCEKSSFDPSINIKLPSIYREFAMTCELPKIDSEIIFKMILDCPQRLDDGQNHFQHLVNIPLHCDDDTF